MNKDQAEAANKLSVWTFATDAPYLDHNTDSWKGEVSAEAMTESQARMFAAEKVDCAIGKLLRVE